MPNALCRNAGFGCAVHLLTMPPRELLCTMSQMSLPIPSTIPSIASMECSTNRCASSGFIAPLSSATKALTDMPMHLLNVSSAYGRVATPAEDPTIPIHSRKGRISISPSTKESNFPNKGGNIIEEISLS